MRIFLTMIISCLSLTALHASYAGKNNPYNEYPLKKESSDDDQPIIRGKTAGRTGVQPTPAMVMPHTSPEENVAKLQTQLQQAQVDLNNAVKNNPAAVPNLKGRIAQLQQQINTLQTAIHRANLRSN